MELIPVHRCDTPHSPGLDIIYIYGVFSSAGDKQSDLWKINLPSLAPRNSNVWGYDLETELGDQFDTVTFMEKSTKLLNYVYQLHQKIKENYRPIVFCCYGLGGVILKKALCQARNRFTQFDELIEYISGIIFLATPHLTKRTTSGSDKLADILRLTSILASESAYSQGTLSRFESVSECFEEINMKVPIISCYESKTTRLKSSTWLPWSSNYKILVDSNLARTWAEHEKFIPIDSDLQAVFDDIGLPIHLAITEFLSGILEAAPQKIKRNIKSLEMPEDLDNESSWGGTNLANMDRSLSSIEESHFTIPNISEPSTQSSDIPNRSFELIENSPNIISPSVSINLPCYCLEPYIEANPDFEGRATVLEMIDTVFHGKLDTSEPKGLIAFTIFGARGMGKTQTAVAYMFSRKSFYDAIFWIPAEDSVKIDQAFSQIAVCLGLETAKDQEDSKYSLLLVHRWLSNPWKPRSHANPTKAKWLMIFDNADNPDIFYDYFPKSAQGCILLTSQQHHKNSICKKGFNLGPLFPNEADALFRRLMDFDYEPEPQHVLEIVQTLSCFPLAIRLMAGIIRKIDLPLDVFLKEYERDDIRRIYNTTTQSSISGNESQSDYGQTLNSIWSTYDLEPGPSLILAVMAFLDSDCIQAEIFTTGTDTAHPHSFPISSDEYFTSLKKLVTLNIITRLEKKDSNKVTIHRIVQDTIRAQMYLEKPYFRQVFAATVQALSSVWPFVLFQKDGSYQSYGRVNRWEKCATLLPHIDSLRRLFELETDKLRYGTLPFATLVTEAAIYLYEIGNQSYSTIFVDTAFKIQENCTDDINLMSIRSALHDIKGSIAMTTNQPDAATFHQEKALNIEKEILAATHVETTRLAAAYSELGRARLMKGSIAEVRQCFETSAEIRKRLPNYDEVQNFNPQRGLAMVDYWYGNWDGARERLYDALQVQEKKFGRDDKEGGRTGALLYWLGNVEFRQGCYAKSKKFHKRALDQICATQRPEHLNAAHAYYKLAFDHMIRDKKEDYVCAIDLLERAAAVYRRDDAHKPELARVKFQYGFALQKIGEVERGEAERQGAWKLRNSLVDDTRPASKLQNPDFDECVEFWSR